MKDNKHFYLQQHFFIRSSSHGHRFQFCANSHPTLWWSLWPLEHANGKFFTVKIILGSHWIWNTRATSKCGLDENPKYRTRSNEGLEGEKLSLSSHWSFHLGNYSLQRNLQGYLGLFEEEVSRLYKSEVCITSSIKKGFWDASNEGRRICHQLLFQNHGD